MMELKTRFNVSMEIRNDQIEVRYGAWVKVYELDADPGDVSRFIGAIVKMNIEKVQRRNNPTPAQVDNSR